jgi:hypothetical protein
MRRVAEEVSSQSFLGFPFHEVLLTPSRSEFGLKKEQPLHPARFARYCS